MPEVPIGEYEIYYNLTGKGEPAIFISGLGSDHTLWHWQIPAHSKNFRCIVFDNRDTGHSRSKKHCFDKN